MEDATGRWLEILVNMAGWVLKDESASHRYHFPASFVLGPGANVRVFSGCGADTSTFLYWCNPATAIWNNDGDTAFLLDPSGNVVDTWAYWACGTVRGASTSLSLRLRCRNLQR